MSESYRAATLRSREQPGPWWRCGRVFFVLFLDKMVGTAENPSVINSSPQDTVTWRDTFQLKMPITGKCR